MGLGEDIIDAAQEHIQGACSQSLSQLPRNKKLEKMIEKAKDESLVSQADKRCKKRNGDVLAYLHALFLGLGGQERAAKVKFDILMCVITHMINDTMKADEVEEVVRSLEAEAGSFSLTMQRDLIELLLTSLDKDTTKTMPEHLAQCWEFFPLAIGAFDCTSSLLVDGESVTAKSYKQQVIERLCSRTWPTKLVTRITTALKEVNLSQDELLRVITKAEQQVSRVECQALPPLVNQMLLLSMKGHKDVVLKGICKAFDQLDQACLDAMMAVDGSDSQEDRATAREEQLRLAQGTVLLHINFAVKQDQQLGTVFLKRVIADKHTVTGFLVAVLLSIARIQHFEKKALDHLKNVALTAFREDVRRSDSVWYKKVTKGKGMTSSALSNAMLGTVRNSSFGWDNVLPSLVQLGFTLLDAGNPKKGRESEFHQTSRLGMSILCETFSLHAVVRGEIMEQLISRIVTRSTSTLACIELLGTIVDGNTQAMAQFLPKIKETFDYISFLDAEIAEGLLNAVRELFRFNRGFQDHVILVLRKAIFSRDLSSRKIGIRGFLQILAAAAQAAPSAAGSSTSAMSQEQKDQFEILGFLRRACTQQADIRELLYSGLAELFAANVSLRGMILDILLVQFHRFYEPQALPPFKLSKCVEKGVEPRLVEPFPRLLSCIQQCLINAPGMDMATPALIQLKESLNSLIMRLPITELEDFELDKSADYSSSTPDGKFNRMTAKILLETCQVLIEYLARQNNIPSRTSIESITKLHTLQESITESVKQGQAAGKKSKPVRASPMLTDAGIIQLVRLFDVMQESDTAELPESTEAFRALTTFHEFVLTVILARVKELATESSSPSLLRLPASSALAMMDSILPSLLFEFAQSWGESSASKRNVPFLALEILEHCLSFVAATQATPAVELIVMKLANSEPAADEADSSVISRQAGEFEMIAGALQEAGKFKEAEAILNVLAALVPHVPGPNVSLHVKWVFETILSKSSTTVGVGLLKKATQLFLALAYSSPACGMDEIRSLCADVNRALGEHEAGEDVVQRGEPEQFTCMEDDQKVLALLPVAFAGIEKHLDELEWAIGFCAADPRNADKVTRHLVQRTGLLLDCFMSLVPADFTGSSVQALLKLTLRVYRILSSLTKQMMDIYGSDVPSLFQQLVDKCGRHLSPQVYTTMFREVEASQASGNIKRETTLMPNLVFESEKFESLLIKYGKKSNKNLLKLFKRSEVRDFRIYTDKLREAAGKGKKRQHEAGDGGPPKKKKK